MVIHKILCPVNFSPASREALVEAVDLARRHEAKLTLVNVMSPVEVGVPEALVDPAYLTQVEEDIARALDSWKADALSVGARAVDARRLVGTAWDAIVETARSEGFEIIVMSTHGRTGLSHAFIGSVAEKVVRHAPCSVLVVRPKVRTG